MSKTAMTRPSWSRWSIVILVPQPSSWICCEQQDLFPQCYMEEFDPILDSADMCPSNKWRVMLEKESAVQWHWHSLSSFWADHLLSLFGYPVQDTLFLVSQHLQHVPYKILVTCQGVQRIGVRLPVVLNATTTTSMALSFHGRASNIGKGGHRKDVLMCLLCVLT